MENSLDIFKKCKHIVTIGSRNSTPRDSHPTKLKAYVRIKTQTQMFLTALFITAKKWKQLRCLPAEGQINRMWHIRTMEWDFAIKRNEGLIHVATRMNFENLILRKGSQSQKATCNIPFVCNVPDRHAHGWKADEWLPATEDWWRTGSDSSKVSLHGRNVPWN